MIAFGGRRVFNQEPFQMKEYGITRLINDPMADSRQMYDFGFRAECGRFVGKFWNGEPIVIPPKDETGGR